ncbi:polysaccharide biosynthesis/export family protein [Roseobacter sp. N2S]|uniref:polysaccharide biosynthesis/export family protein n=1 Tax=Roseobacter sp. N2S TaxID=2663844 RepID=UPI00285A4795|nr:polysaccharide biosynthesis/export family protein [Roseobacter sp. N2S]MDR6267644.1 polysaccharide export outer membrane protein [Roseobacter sp. N2S]
MSQRLFSALKHVLLLGVALGIIAACTLPRGAPLQREMTKQKQGEPAEFAVYQVTKNLLPQIDRWPSDPTADRHWLRHGGATSVAITPGDMVNLTIWDSEVNSLLTTTDQKSTKLENIIVSRNGTIFMPYLEKIHIAGLSADTARQKIQNQMEQIIPSAQVQLSVVPGSRHSVDLVGGVASPGSYPLNDPDGHVTVLGLISQGGGVSDGMDNPQVSLTRGSKVYQIALKQIYEDPTLDTVVQGRDKVIVASDDRYFRSLGASSTEAIIPFNRETISALDAMSMIGGLQDSRADPKGILILREYPPSAVKSGGPNHQRVIFTVDLTQTDGLFSAGKFMIHPEDTVMVTESPVVLAETVIGLFTSTVRGANTAF